LIERFPQAETWLGAFGISDVAQISMARALFGEIAVRGHLPVTIPGVQLKAGYGIEVAADPMKLQPMDVRGEAQLQPAFDVIQAAIKDKAFPGATLAIDTAAKFHCTLSEDSHTTPKLLMWPSNTMYDIASLTKVVATTRSSRNLSKATFLFRSTLTRTSNANLPEWASGPQPEWRHRVTVRHLLTHTSGLPPFKEYWRASKINRTRWTRFSLSRSTTNPEQRKCIQIWESF